MVSRVLCGKFVPIQMHIPSQSFVPDLNFSVSTNSNHHLASNSVMSFEPVHVNVSFAPMHMPVNVVKSVSCNLHVPSLAKLMFIKCLQCCKIREFNTSYL